MAKKFEVEEGCREDTEGLGRGEIMTVQMIQPHQYSASIPHDFHCLLNLDGDSETPTPR